MRNLIINTFISLDGVMQAPGGPEEDPEEGFKYGGWSFNYWDDVMNNIIADSMAKPFEILLGRKTYEIFAAFWPTVKDSPLNNVKKYVVSKTLTKTDWNNSILIKNNVVEEINKLREQNGPEIQVHGSSNLIQTLLKNNLIDEYRVWIFPVLLGKGKKLFGEGTNTSNLHLITNKLSSTGVIINTYKPGGELKTGAFSKESEEEFFKKSKK